jgi:hypothetical protein
MIARTLAFILALSGLWVSPALLAQATSACHAPDSTSALQLEWLKNVVSGTDPAAVAQRSQMGLPQVSAGQVSYVTDKTVCSKVLNVYKSNVQGRVGGVPIPSSGKLYVFKVGTAYTANDPAQNMGEFAIWVSVDSRYNLLGSSMG